MPIGRSTAAAALGLATAAQLSAQATGTLDVGASYVHYDGFLAAGATFLAPAIQYDAPGLSIGLRGTAVIFETGNSILQGTVAGAWITRADRGVRMELSGSAGAAAYLDAPRYGHALGRVRVHWGSRRWGSWLGATSGRSFFGDTVQTPLELATGGWVAWDGVGVGGTVTRSLIGDTAYTDLAATGRWLRGGVTVEGVGGSRVWSRGGGHGLYGEVTVRWRLAAWMTVSVGGGRYPTDPIRGVVAAKYANAAVRLTLAPRRPPPPTRFAAALDSAYTPPAAAGARLVTAHAAPGQWTLRVQIASGAAQLVEIAGDFTDWEPVRLTRVGPATWEVVLAIPEGVHRVNVRLDGGAWDAPAGVRQGRGDFGGVVGLLVIG